MTLNVPDETAERGAPPPELVTRVFSFGVGHVCPYTGKELIDHHATITAPDAVACRAVMLSLFGRQWAFEYVSLDACTRGGQYPSTEHARVVLPGGDPARSKQA